MSVFASPPRHGCSRKGRGVEVNCGVAGLVAGLSGKDLTKSGGAVDMGVQRHRQGGEDVGGWSG
eukprot:358969-Chlamydomonas_euryale.AAC.2